MKYKSWFEKKDKSNTFVCFESNLTEVPHNTWWLDFGATTHISNLMHGFLTIKTTNPTEDFMFIEYRMKFPIEGIGTYHLILDTGYHLDLLQIVYAPSISRNLVSLSKLDVSEFNFKFGHDGFSLYKNASFIGSGILIDGLYKLKLNNLFMESLLTMHHNSGIKYSLLNKNSAYLWHKCLGHISKERIARLVKNEILPNLDFTNLGIYIDCIETNQTHKERSPKKYTAS